LVSPGVDPFQPIAGCDVLCECITFSPPFPHRPSTILRRGRFSPLCGGFFLLPKKIELFFFFGLFPSPFPHFFRPKKMKFLDLGCFIFTLFPHGRMRVCFPFSAPAISFPFTRHSFQSGDFPHRLVSLISFGIYPVLAAPRLFFFFASLRSIHYFFALEPFPSVF